MTLNQTIINKWGIWQCSDHRTIDLINGKVIDDYSVKHVILQCPDGTALLAYAGASRMSCAGSVVEVSDWIRETLRGESRTVDQSLILIRENATRDLAPSLRAGGICHMFSIGTFLGGRPWAVQIRNFTPTAGVLVPLNQFETAAMQAPDSGLGLVFGDPRAITHQHHQQLKTLASRKPRQPKDFQKALASMNHRVATTPAGRRTISPDCVTSFLPPVGHVESEFHGKAAATDPLVVPMLLFGIDTTETMRAMQKMVRGGTLSSSPGSAALSLEQESAARRAVIPRNRLRRRRG